MMYELLGVGLCVGDFCGDVSFLQKAIIFKNNSVIHNSYFILLQFVYSHQLKATLD